LYLFSDEIKDFKEQGQSLLSLPVNEIKLSLFILMAYFHTSTGERLQVGKGGEAPFAPS
jgi:hypothetical protein